MKEIFTFLSNYFRACDKRVLLITSILVATLISINYTIGIERNIKSYPEVTIRILGFFLLYSFVFIFVYGIQFYFEKWIPMHYGRFFLLLILCPLLFALKIAINPGALLVPEWMKQPWYSYWTMVLNWPAKGLIVLIGIFLIWKSNGYPGPAAGMNRQFKWKPYLLLLLCVIPLIAFAATQTDFQHTYPKLKNISLVYPYTSTDGFFQLLYEISYGLDFFTIEVFFRGLLVLGFIRYAGIHSIIPMAAFYCTIHFGKPMFECITSFAGGILLGAIVYHTRSIWGGLVVHLGLAWMMELAGFLGNKFQW